MSNLSDGERMPLDGTERAGDAGRERAIALPDAAKRKRLIWFAAMVRDIYATIGTDAGMAWLREHDDLIRRNLAAAQREWNATQAGIRQTEANDG